MQDGVLLAAGKDVDRLGLVLGLLGRLVVVDDVGESYNR